MAFNRQIFKTRALTASLFVIVMLVGLLWNQWSFLILFSIIHFGCWLEYQRLIGLIDSRYKEITPFHKYGIMIAGWCLMLWFTGETYKIGQLRLHEMGWWIGLVIVFILPLTELLLTWNIRVKNIAYSVFGLIYISLTLALLVDLSNLVKNYDTGEIIFGSFNKYYPALIIFSLWINDTMAYIVGSFIGKTPLTKISPKKTWEGTIGGIILTIGMAFLIPTLFNIRGIDPLTSLIVAASVAVAGTLGDLFESKLKRMAGVKDSSQLMPGHGGFLDRFDSLLFSIPIAWFLLQPCAVQC